MKTIVELLTGIVSDAFAARGFDPSLGEVGVSDRPELCQFQCNGAFAQAKRDGRPPMDIAGEVAEILSRDSRFSRVEAARPGFLNLTLDDGWLLSLAAAVEEDPHLGIPQIAEPETIVLDYGGPNVAKPLHIGHLRAAIIGESLKRIARATGRRVIGDVHLGDWGLQIGLVIAELEERHPGWPCFSPEAAEKETPVPPLDPDSLNELYPLASQKSKGDDAFRDKARRITAALQAGHAGYLAVWREIIRVSVADLKENYRRLGVDFDLWYGDSDAEKYVPALLDIRPGKGLLRESEGAQVVDVAEEGDKTDIPPVIIKKSDNSSIYATTDLATILQRQQDYAPRRIWYVVDKRQGLHFTQVFRCAHKAGLVPPETELSHLGFGTMNGSDGRPYKTRDGGVMRLSDFLSAATEAALVKMENGAAFESEEERRETARRIGVAAIKFGDLSNHRTKDYIFDMDKFLSFEGKTGTYLLYTLTRIQSLFNKAGSDMTGCRLNGVYADVERELLLAVLLTGEAFRRAVEEKAPNYICESAYRLASLFSRFYHDSRIVSEPDPDRRESWLALCRLTRVFLLLHLEVLGIEPVEKM